MNGWPRVRRVVASWLCWIFVLQVGPAWGEVLSIRTEPLAKAREWSVQGLAASGGWLRARVFEARLSSLRAGVLLSAVAVAAQGEAEPADLPPDPPDFARGRANPVAPVRGEARPVSLGDLPLLPGWNLISLHGVPVDPSPSSVFSPLGSALGRVHAYDSCDPADPWKVYDPADPAGSDLTAASETQGLWLEAAAPSGLPTPGEPPLSATIHLCPGWNLIGFPATEARPVQKALASIAGQYVRVFGYDPADPADPWEIHDVGVPAWANDLKVLQPGRGYWLLATAETDLTVTNGGEGISVEIAQPAQLAEVTGPVTVVGTIRGGALSEWELRFRRVGEEEWTTLGTGTDPVSNGELGMFDPTLLLNDLYEIELAATDASGEGVSLATHVVVEGRRKIGYFTISFPDLEVPLSGLPIRIVRTYDSRDRQTRDFGHGWTIDVRQGSYRNNRPPGEGWRIVSGFLPCQVAQETRPHLATLRLSDREVYRFRPRMDRLAITAGGCFAEAGFAFVDGPVPGATLEILGPSSVFYANGDNEVVEAESQETFEPRAVRLTTRDGRVFDFDLTLGVTRLADANGNELEVSDAGITHSDGRGIPFTRDAQGRITAITDPKGKTIRYVYDSAGDLVEVIDREERTTRFTYQDDHFLLTIEDARGIQPLRNEYDNDGRLIRHVDAFGKSIDLTHDLAGRREVVTDRLRHSRVLEYDERGNVVRETDALGKITTRTFDANDQMLSETNPLGETTTWRYDQNRNLIEVENPLHHKTRYTYNARGQILTVTDARGKVTAQTYDDHGNRLSTTDPLGNSTTYTYDGRGNLSTETDPEGAVTAYAYDGFGNLVQETDALGVVATSTYDVAGNRLARSTTRTTSSGTETATWSYSYDGQDRLTRVTDPRGHFFQEIYNNLGQRIESIDRRGARTAYTYDDMGRLIETRFPDGTTEKAIHDAEDHLTVFEDRGGRRTVSEYDPVGRLIKITHPDQAVSLHKYDDAGRLIEVTDALGHATVSVYDAAGRQVLTRDALGRQTIVGYDENGNRTSAQDARLNITLFQYDDANRLVQVPHPDGTFRRTVYDRTGRPVEEIGPDGRSTKLGYDKLGRLTSVTDALLQVTRYGYDEQGNRVSQTDANGHETRFEHDALGQMIRRTLPGGAFETFTYDAEGNQTARTAFSGASFELEYDLSSRLTKRRSPDGSVVTFESTPSGLRSSVTDSRGVTRYTYDARDRLTDLTWPDGKRLSHTYDPQGNRTSTTVRSGAESLTTSYAYDALNRLETVTDPAGRVYSYAYDDTGNRSSLNHPNGVTTTYAYDALNRLTSLVSRTSAGTLVQSYALTLDGAGRRTRIEEQDGTSRRYSYDDLDRLTEENVSRGGATLFRNVFAYDAVGNRLRQERTEGGGVSSVVTSTYDARDRLLSENDVSYEWDANGNQIRGTGAAGADFVWDAENRPVEVTLAGGKVVRHRYDADGHRIATETWEEGELVRRSEYLVDPEHRLGTGDPGLGLSQVIAVIEDGAPGISEYHVRGTDLLATLRGSEVRFVHGEDLGTVRALTDETASVSDRYTFEAFGSLLAHQGTDPGSVLFAGEPFDQASGLYQLRARWLSPGQGRFLSGDPLLGQPDLPSSLHRYTYAANNPILYGDPTGEETSAIGLQGVSLGQMVLALGLALEVVCILDFAASTVGGQAGFETPDMSPGGVCHNESKRENGAVRVQLQRGNNHFDAERINATNRYKGVTVIEFEAGLVRFFQRAKTHVPGHLHPEFLSAVIQMGRWARYTAQPSGGIYFSTSRRTIHEEPFPLRFPKEKRYRVDLENLHGRNLMHVY